MLFTESSSLTQAASNIGSSNAAADPADIRKLGRNVVFSA
jgi:hypothetical protein